MMSHLNNEMSITKIDDLHDLTIPSGYKNTDVGLIPLDWAVVDMEQIASIIDPQPDHRTPPESSSGEPYIGISDFLNSVKVDWDSSRKIIRSAVDKQQARFQIDKGDIVFGKIGTIGVPKFVPEVSFRFALSANVILLKPKIEPNFLMAFFYSDLFNRVLKSELHSTSQAAFGINKMRFIKVPLPNKQEQTTIANALSDVDALIQELEKLIAKKQAIKTATMQQLLTGRTRLPQFSHYPDGRPKGYKPSEHGEIPEDWEFISIGRDTVLKARIGWQALTTKEYQTSGDIFLVTGTDFDSGEVKWERCFYVSEWRYRQDQNIQLKNHDVLITKDGTIGKVGYVAALSRPATLNSGIFVVRPKNNKLMQRFLFYVLTSRVFDDFINRITAGSTITHLYQKDFVNFEFPAPCIQEQGSIATILSDIDEEILALEQRLNKTRQIKQGMMQELLTGKTRLVKPAGAA